MITSRVTRKYITTLKTNMAKRNVRLNFRLNKIDETRSNLLEEIKLNDAMSEKHKKVCRVLNYFELFLVSIFVVSRCVLISSFFSLVCIHVDIASSEVGLKICVITAGIEKYKSITKKKAKKHDNIVLLAKIKLNTIKVLIPKALIDSYMTKDDFVSVNNVLRKYNEIKEENQKSESAVKYTV